MFEIQNTNDSAGIEGKNVEVPFSNVLEIWLWAHGPVFAIALFLSTILWVWLETSQRNRLIASKQKPKLCVIVTVTKIRC